MNWFRNLKIRTKILSIVILMALFIGSVGFVGYYYNVKANNQMDDMYSNNLMTVKYLNDSRAQIRAGESATFHFLLATEKESQEEEQNETKTRADNFDIDFNAYMKIPASESYELKTAENNSSRTYSIQSWAKKDVGYSRWRRSHRSFRLLFKKCRRSP